MVTINDLEFAVIIINFAAATLCLRLMEDVLGSGHPVLLNHTDNTSALAWLTKTPHNTRAGAALMRLFASLHKHSKWSIRAKYISTKDNEIADVITRPDLRDSSTHDLSSLILKYPELQQCRRFVPSDELISETSSALSTASLRDDLSAIPLGRLEPASASS